MKVKIWCEKVFRKEYIKEDINADCITIGREKVVDIDLRDIIIKFGQKGYYYTNELYDLIHKKYRYIDLFSYNGDELEYKIVEEGYLDDIPYFDEPITSIKQFEGKMKRGD